ncbi:MAG: hypothetical protein IPQ01_13040 [Zoogloea sp.]|nr:hypothetical protein [Zoogloea sp.]
MTYNALRKGRVSIPGQIYLLTAVTWDRTPWCQDFRLGREVAGVLHGVAVAYPVHWLVQLPDGVSLERLMQIFKGRSARALNVAGLRTGPVWQPGFHDRALRKDEPPRRRPPPACRPCSVSAFPGAIVSACFSPV